MAALTEPGRFEVQEAMGEVAACLAAWAGQQAARCRSAQPSRMRHSLLPPACPPPLCLHSDGVVATSDDVHGKLQQRQQEVEELGAVRALMHKLQAVFDLPRKLRAAVDREAYEVAADCYADAAPLLRKYGHKVGPAGAGGCRHKVGAAGTSGDGSRRLLGAWVQGRAPPMYQPGREPATITACTLSAVLGHFDPSPPSFQLSLRRTDPVSPAPAAGCLQEGGIRGGCVRPGACEHPAPPPAGRAGPGGGVHPDDCQAWGAHGEPAGGAASYLAAVVAACCMEGQDGLLTRSQYCTARIPGMHCKNVDGCQAPSSARFLRHSFPFGSHFPRNECGRRTSWSASGSGWRACWRRLALR